MVSRVSLTLAKVSLPRRSPRMAESEKPSPAKTLNINVGILGHVDSGKTSLSRALSTIGSTACFDKHPQSKERGITLDLGFSSFVTELPEQLVGQLGQVREVGRPRRGLLAHGPIVAPARVGPGSLG